VAFSIYLTGKAFSVAPLSKAFPMARPDSRSLPVAVLLTALAAFGPVSIDLYLPSLPAMVAVFHSTVSDVQLTLSVFIGGFAVGTLVHGPLSDRYGRRPVVLAGCILYCFASIACLFAPSIEMLTLGRFVQALGAAAGPVIGRAVVRDVYPRKDAARLLSYMASAIAIAPAIGPLIGGWLQSVYGWQSNFVLFTAFGLCVLVASWALLSETNTHRDSTSLTPIRLAQTFGMLLRSRLFVGHSLAVSLAFGCMFSFISGAAFIIIDVMGVAEQHFGFAFLSVVAGFSSGAFLSGRLSSTLGSGRTIEIGCGVLLVGSLSGALLAWFGAGTAPMPWNVISVVGPVTLVFFSGALIIPNATAQAISPYGHVAGAASSLLGFLQMGIGALVGAIVGLTFTDSALPMMIQIAILSLGSVACYSLLVGRREIED
jgi:DHA1 family bicyclomycin/chloramphenicol resistance-like MFS transporter